ncbi:MAG: hypothetical protein VKN72_04190 [Nostocales cyanobacterium 94392]|nr:hypothetical protein [Nostocales cyanobacterium 94392]
MTVGVREWGWGDKGMGGWGDGEMGGWGDGETRGWGDKGMGRQGDGAIAISPQSWLVVNSSSLLH